MTHALEVPASLHWLQRQARRRAQVKEAGEAAHI